MWQGLGLHLYQGVYYCLMAVCPDVVETTALDVWTKALGKGIYLQPVAPACVQP